MIEFLGLNKQRQSPYFLHPRCNGRRIGESANATITMGIRAKSVWCAWPVSEVAALGHSGIQRSGLLLREA